MSTVTKKELVDRIAAQTGNKRLVVKQIIQSFLGHMVDELGKGNRLEFRDFGVFESRYRTPRIAQNPKTLQRVQVAGKRTVKFKIGRLLKNKLLEGLESAHPSVSQANPTTADTHTGQSSSHNQRDQEQSGPSAEDQRQPPGW